MYNNLSKARQIATNAENNLDRHSLEIKFQERLQHLISSFELELTTDQQRAITKLWQFIHSTNHFFLLAGYAGTGKSTIVFAVIKELVRLGKRIVITAPTNKAVEVVRSIAIKQGLSIDCFTIHQLMGLSVVDKRGKRSLEQTTPSKVYLYDLIFLDECSMVGKELWDSITAQFLDRNLLLSNRKLVLMGDPAQLYPVGEGLSPTFKVEQKIVMKEVVRQTGNSPLLNFVTATRAAIRAKSKIFRPKASPCSDGNTNGAFKVNKKTLIKYALHQIKANFDSDPNCFRILCYTNKQVNYYNQIIRQEIYGKDSPRYIPGERLIAKKAIFNPEGKAIVISTSTEFTVLDAVETKYFNYQAYRLKISDAKSIKQIYVLHESEQKRFQTELKEKLEAAKERPFFWYRYYQFRDKIFAEVDNCYALTVHNSQGSTFSEGAIDSKDLLKRLYVGDELERKKLKEYHRLWYVGSSRMQRKLLFT
ncbi:MAG: AAA family ATPase, partial [Waterburya sp.]